MLQVTDAAVSAFKKVLEHDERGGGGIRLVPNPQPDGRTSVGVEPIREPGPNDEPTEARGLTIVVARDLAPSSRTRSLTPRRPRRAPTSWSAPNRRPNVGPTSRLTLAATARPAPFISRT